MLARYRILHELGRGATSAVYAASDRTTGEVVALQRLDPSLAESDPGLVQRFLARARSARNLKHPNIVRIHDAGDAAGTAYVAMEMLEGESLRKILDEGPLPVARAIRLAHEIASGLAHAHLEGVVHGGIQPASIAVLRSGAAKIADFCTGTGGPGYLSPEQARGEPVDHRSDIFSLGALFYEMLTGRRPFEGDAAKEPPPPSELNPHAPRALDPIVLSMLARDPAARMPGVPVLLRELERLEEGLGLEAAPPQAGTDEPAVKAAPFDPEPRAPDVSSFDIPPDLQRRMMERESRAERPSRSRPGMLAALALMLTVLGIGLSNFNVIGLADLKRLSGFMEDLPPRPGERDVAASRIPKAPAPVPEVSRRIPPSPVAEAPVEPAPEPTPRPPPPLAPAPVPQAESVAESAPEKSAPVVAAPAPQLPPLAPPTMKPVAKAPPQPPEKSARLVLSVSPRGELYIDGEHRGTTPPTTTFELEPGMRRIEVRSGSRKPYLTYMTLEPGDVRRIRHDFNAKPIRPPG
ncbi:MAG TPA: serine/threonine-protein kinase [Burkholderiales bacterium]|nr:serine/threonine-protein kinase [Burkholderiales bacterium]